MRVRSIHALVFVLVLSVFAADFGVGCGHGYVYGPVTQKYRSGSDAEAYTIAVNGSPYPIPLAFYSRVEVGDWVRYNGSTWEIVKTAGGATPTNP